MKCIIRLTVCCLLFFVVIPGQGAEVEVGNLIYAGNKTSKCFSDNFLKKVSEKTAIDTGKTFKKVRLDDLDALAETPFAIMNGQAKFKLTKVERENLFKWLDSGGFLVASAGCSDASWSGSMRRELVTVFSEEAFVTLDKSHLMFHTLFDLDSVPLKGGKQAKFEGVVIDGRLVCIFSSEGLNDTASVSGCCCCGGDEVRVASEVVANALIYSLVE